MASLTPLQRKFIDEYFLCGLNATEAVIRAGYQVSNRETAAVIGSENLRKPKIAAEIERRLQETTMDANEVLFRLSQQARSNPADLMSVNQYGVLTFDLDKIRQNGHLVKEIKFRVTDEGNEVHIKMHDAQSALVQLGRAHQLFTDNVKVTDWRDEAIAAIRAGDIDYETLSDELGYDLAQQLFQQAGVPIRVD